MEPEDASAMTGLVSVVTQDEEETMTEDTEMGSIMEVSVAEECQIEDTDTIEAVATTAEDTTLDAATETVEVDTVSRGLIALAQAATGTISEVGALVIVATIGPKATSMTLRM